MQSAKDKHDLFQEDPVHHRFHKGEAELFKKFLEGCDFVELSLMHLEQSFKFGCKWGMAKIYDTNWQLHVAMFPGQLTRHGIC